MHFNMFSQTDSDNLRRMLEIVNGAHLALTQHSSIVGEDVSAARESVRQNPNDTAAADELDVVTKLYTTITEWVCVAWIMKATLLRELERYEEAESIYDALIQRHSEQPFVHEQWVAPYAFYHKAVLRYKVGDSTTCRKLLTKVSSGFGDYNFEMQMQFRCHLTNDVLKKRGTNTVGVDS